MTRPLEPLPLTTDRDQASEAAAGLRVRVELLDMAARSGTFAGWVTLCVSAFLFMVLRDTDRLSPLAGWLAVMVGVSVVRIGMCQYWRHARADATRARRMPDAAGAQRWETYHVVVAAACGAAWASLVFFTVSHLERTTLLVGFALTIALMLASTSYVTNRLANLLFALPIVAAQGFNLDRLAAEYHTALGLAWLVLIAVLYLVPRMSSIPLRKALRERIDHERRAAAQTALIETAPLGIIVVRDERIVICNDALLRLLGYVRKEDLIGQHARVLMPGDEEWQRAHEDATALRHGPFPPRIVRRRRSDGSLIDVMLNMAIVRGTRGEREVIGIYEDVRERLASEERFQHASRMQRLVFESAGEGIAIVNDGIIEQANQALSDLVGVPVAQLADRPLQSIFEDPHHWAEIERRFQRLGNTLKLERRLVRSDGRAIWANVTGCLVDAPVERVDAAGTSVSSGKRSIWILADLTVQKQKEAENWHHANHDVMTGLPNRRFLQDRLDQALAFARRDGRRVAVVELDLDGFKSVNDTYGHRFGDAVLEEVARRLSTVVRELDTVGRWGGDEFVLVLKELESREIVEDTVRRVIARLSEPIIYMGHNLSIGASIGIALFPDHGEEVEVLMLAADLAMYESKSSGGNTWRFSSPSAHAPRGKYRPSTAQQLPIDG